APRRGSARGTSLPPPPPKPEPRLDVVRESASSEGWNGRVVDAHDELPVASAKILVERPGFQGTYIVARADAGDDGAFTLEAFDTAPGDVLSISGALHAELRCPVPPAGELRIALVLRKRALLDRL